MRFVADFPGGGLSRKSPRLLVGRLENVTMGCCDAVEDEAYPMHSQDRALCQPLLTAKWSFDQSGEQFFFRMGFCRVLRVF